MKPLGNGSIDGWIPERDEQGEYMATVWPGGYPVIYLDEEGNVFCPRCANATTGDDPKLVACGPYYEGPGMLCDGCSAWIESAYGDPAEEQ